MSKTNRLNSVEGIPNAPRVHAWEPVAGFALALPQSAAQDAAAPKECMLEPAVQSLKSFGLQEPLLREMCAAVEKTGEELRADCPTGVLGYVNVRVLVANQSLRGGTRPAGQWRYYIIKQMASSESDNLDAVNDPRCYIDLHVYQEE